VLFRSYCQMRKRIFPYAGAAQNSSALALGVFHNKYYDDRYVVTSYNKKAFQ